MKALMPNAIFVEMVAAGFSDADIARIKRQIDHYLKVREIIKKASSERREREFSTVGVTFSEGYIHTVEPIAGAEKRDIRWIGVLQRRHPSWLLIFTAHLSD
jgi:hypothetical protein